MQPVVHSSLSRGLLNLLTPNAQVQHFWEFCRLYFELLLHVFYLVCGIRSGCLVFHSYCSQLPSPWHAGSVNAGRHMFEKWQVQGD